MLIHYQPVVLFMVLAIGLAVLAYGLGMLISPSHPDDEKNTAYECGFDPFEEARMPFDVRFYLVAILFIIFDVEGALLFPAAAVYKKFNEVGAGGTALISILIFIGVLIEGIVYCWRKGDLDWVKSFQISPGQGRDDK